MVIQDKKIAIVGGGPGGLTLARILQMHGADVKVYERDVNKDVRVQGATLDLHDESGLLALNQAGLMDAFKANYRPGAEKIRVLDQYAKVLYDEHTTTGSEIPGAEILRPEIDRGPLRQLLLESLQPETVVWNSQFYAMSPTDSGWKLEFKNGSSALADIVIAADGANSKIRPLITAVQPFYSGVTIVEGTVYDAENAAPAIYDLLKGGKLFAFGDSKSLIVSSKGDGSITFYTGCNAEETWISGCGIDFSDKAQVHAWFREEFTDWSNTWDELFESEQVHFVTRPQYCMPLDQTWEAHPNLTMLGDAAHLMPPYAGEGVNMAMLDALELSECLLSDEHADTRSAIAAYETRMRARAAEVGRITLEQTAALHGPGAISHMLQVFS